MNAGAAARRYLRHHRHGVLSTISKKLGGFPFGSVVPYVPDDAARPVIFISRLAEHTRNIDADPRVSLLVRDDGADAQDSARLTVIGNAARVIDDPAALQARYLDYVPAAQRLVALGDFSFYRIAPVALRYIGGFGDIRWISAEEYAPPVNTMAASAGDIVAHMNSDHGAALRDYCRHFLHRVPATAAMIGIDCDGFDLRADGELLRCDFDPPVADANAARAALIALVKRVRA